MIHKCMLFLVLIPIILSMVGCADDVIKFKIKSVIPLPGLQLEGSMERSYTINELKEMVGSKRAIHSNEGFKIFSEIQNSGRYSENGYFEITYSTKNFRYLRPADLSEYKEVSIQPSINEFGEEVNIAKYRIGDLHRGNIEVDFVGYTKEIGGLSNETGRAITEYIEITVYDSDIRMDSDVATIEICSLSSC